jgi:hypothetical protein
VRDDEDQISVARSPLEEIDVLRGVRDGGVRASERAVFERVRDEVDEGHGEVGEVGVDGSEMRPEVVGGARVGADLLV